ncbi:MAG: redox-regulated ATPase YchF [Candidatus Wallbacteria bacterium]
MKIGIIGLPGVGKTTLFNALTRSSIATGTRSSDTNIATIKVPDERIDFLSQMYKPKKTSYANVEFVDIAGVIPGTASAGDNSGGNLLNNAKTVDVICQVVRVFDENGDMFDELIDIVRDVKKINDELLLSDLALIENRLSRMNLKKKTNTTEIEEKLLEKMKIHLEAEKMLYTFEMTKDEEALISGYKFLSLKRQLIVLNIEEKLINTDLKAKYKEAVEYIEKLGVLYLPISAKIEMEISQLEGDDEKMFLAENNLKEPGRNFLIRKAYETLGNISFFTAGEDEVKAWTIVKGNSAHDAAGKIHSDIQRGFIRAEVVSYQDFMACKGTVEDAKAQGKMRLEQKPYVVHDGDIINFRFNA